MNDDEKEVLKVGAEAVMAPFADLIKKLFGGPIEQVGGMWTDGLIVRRQIRRINLFRKLKATIERAGFEPRAIPDKIWIRLESLAMPVNCRYAELMQPATRRANDGRADETALGSFHAFGGPAPPWKRAPWSVDFSI